MKKKSKRDLIWEQKRKKRLAMINSNVKFMI